MKKLYNISIYLYQFLIRLAGVFSPKAKKWIKGRKGLFDEIKNRLDPDEKIAWFHCASLGEFEQGRPLIEAFRHNHSDYKIVLTFFSPSGYEIRKNYSGADYIFYLPADTSKNAVRFVSLIHPSVAIFIKYEFWYNYLAQLHHEKIPVIMASAIFRPGQPFFKWYGTWFKKQLQNIHYFFVQNDDSEKLLQSIGLSNVAISGDTRFDRVHEIAIKKKSFPLIEKFIAGSQVLIAGSTWPKDEELILSLLNDFKFSFKLIIAPHEIHEIRIRDLVAKTKGKAIRYSNADNEQLNSYQILIIDTIGILSQLYQYAFVSYIGGGFGKGIHNILEAVTFGIPVIFGPEYKKFDEAVDLINLKGAFCIHHKEELNNIIHSLIDNPDFYKICSDICTNFVKGKTGATQMIMQKIEESVITKKG